MERVIFRQLKFKRRSDSTKHVRDTQVEFFIPGVNSGVYSPATICVSMRIEQITSGFFKFKKSILGSSITLTTNEFDELFEEMRKIKELRENVKI